MPHSYYNHRSYKSVSNGGHAAFILILLLLGVTWAHKTVMLKVEHYALIFSVACSVAVCLVIIYKQLRRSRSWPHKPNHASLDIDGMNRLAFERYVASHPLNDRVLLTSS